MEVSNVVPAQPTLASAIPRQAAFNVSSMDVDMDLDVNLDLDENEESMNIEEPITYREDDALEPEGLEPFDTQDHQPQTDEQLVPEKVHIRGLDNLTTDDVKAFIAEHSEVDFSRFEWIDDTSANLVYDSSEIAISVLYSLVDPATPLDDSSDLSQLRKAKPFSTHPFADLHIRLAFTTDAKKPRAREASRFYLMNPEHDPWEKRRQRRPDRGGDRRREHRHNNRHQSEEAEVPFDETMYDEEPTSLSARIDRPIEPERRSRRRSNRSRDPDRRRRGGDLFVGRLGGDRKDDERLRERSASPLREGDGRYGFDEDESAPRSRRIRQRSLTPPLRAGPRSKPTNGNAGKELMDISSSKSPVSRTAPAKELFPANGSSNKELFPRKTPLGNHRRKLAFDAGDETADLFADQLVKRSPELRTRSLADRITGGPQVESSRDNEELEGINIRGTALGLNNPKVKELFPDRAGGNNGGIDLFEGRIAGRGGQRRRAQDLF